MKTNHKKAGMAILISDKTDLTIKYYQRNFHNEETINSSRRQKIQNLYALSNRALKYMKQKLTELKGETDKPIVGGF